MKEYNFFLDSNIFLRPIVKDDEIKLNECKDLFSEVSKNKLIAITSSFVLAEIVWICQKFYGLDKGTVAGALKRILNYKGIKILDDSDSALAVDIYERYNIKFIDALIASHPKIQSKEMIIVSYDKDFDKLGIIRKEPGEIIKKK